MGLRTLHVPGVFPQADKYHTAHNNALPSDVHTLLQLLRQNRGEKSFQEKGKRHRTERGRRNPRREMERNQQERCD